MKSLKICVVVFACTLALVLIRGAFSTPASANGPVRNFVFTYLTKIPALPPGDKVSQMWIPLPQSDRYQTIRRLKIDAPFAYAERRDPEYGNEYLYVQVPASKLTAPSEVRVSFEATRREHRVSLNAHSAASEARATSPELQRFLEPDRLIPLQGTIEELSAQQTRGLQDPLAKARAIYDYVVATLRYDKSGTGWGNGDAIWACTAKRGNCTDFHSLLIGMMRAAGIPRAL